MTMTAEPRALRSQVVPFAVVGALTSLAYLALYAGLEPFAGAQAANALALLLTADANTVANRRLTFGLTGGAGQGSSRAKGWLAFGVSWVFTSATLSALSAAGTSAALPQLLGLLAANVAAGVVHLLLLRHWAFPRAAVQPG